jgi:DNA-binding response OmpR family regulator
MSLQAVFLAETDPRTLDLLPRILSEHLPSVDIDICTSGEALARKLSAASYDTVAISPGLLREYRRLRPQKPYHLIAPILVTASQEERALASMALEEDAFDLIVKPIVPHEAVQSVRLALWQNRLLRLLASNERASARFREHMAAFPHARTAEAEFMSKRAAYERTYQALTSSMRLLLNIEEEQSVFDMAASVESLTKKQAIKRLFNMPLDGPTQ